MRFDRIRVHNFLRLAEVDAAFPGTCHVVAGGNESGKSSLLEAIRFVFRGDNPRIWVKKNHDRLIRRGAKKGSVEIHDGERKARRNVKDGKLTGQLLDQAPEPTALAIAIGVKTFGNLDLHQRREFLLDLCDVRLDADQIMARLEKRGLPAKLLERVRPLLAGGWEAVQPEAKTKISELRGQWQEITGERYGSKKAEDWEAELPAPPDDERLAEIEREIEACRESVATRQKDLGALRYRLNNAKQSGPDRETIEDANADLDRLLERSRTLTEKRDRAFEKGEAGDTPVMPCPECGVELVGDKSGFGTLQRLVRADAMKEQSIDARAEYEKYNAELREVQSEIKKVRPIAETPLPSGDNPDELAKEIEATESSLASAQNEAGALEAEKRDLEQRGAEYDRAKDATERAGKVHQAIEGWQQVADMMAPDGIPGEILAESLRPINDALIDSCRAGGWEPVQIDADMTIRRGADDYDLLSESARWLADAALGDVVSRLSGFRFLALDRLDVIEPARRGSVFRWMATIAEHHDQIIAVGTFKEKPQFTADAPIMAHWMQSGEMLD